MDVKGKLKRLREARGWSLARAGAEAGVSAPVIYRIESGTVKNPGILTLRGLTQAYGVTLDELFDDSTISLTGSINRYMEDEEVTVAQWARIKKVLDLVLKE